MERTWTHSEIRRNGETDSGSWSFEVKAKVPSANHNLCALKTVEAMEAMIQVLTSLSAEIKQQAMNGEYLNT